MSLVSFVLYETLALIVLLRNVNAICVDTDLVLVSVLTLAITMCSLRQFDLLTLFS